MTVTNDVFYLFILKKSQYLKVEVKSEHDKAHVRPQNRERYKTLWVFKKWEEECGAFIPTISTETLGYAVSSFFLSNIHTGEKCIV